MAIYIEEEKGSKGSLFSTLATFVILIIIGVAIYYVFFVKPEIIENITPSQLQSIDNIVNINFDPSEVFNGEFFNSLNQNVPEYEPGPAGNSSPFGVF